MNLILLLLTILFCANFLYATRNINAISNNEYEILLKKINGEYEELRKKLQPMNRPLSNSGRKVIWTNAILKVRLKKFGWYEIENIKW